VMVGNRVLFRLILNFSCIPSGESNRQAMDLLAFLLVDAKYVCGTPMDSESSSSISAPSGASAQMGPRPDNYYSAERSELVELLPVQAHRVLEIGCGEGLLGKRLRARGHYVAGVELVPEIAEQARRNLDEVLCADVERAEFPWGGASFDALIMADVLEHMVDPWRALGRLIVLLKPGGIAIASIPNVQNFRIIRDLLLGKWRYTDSGLMDRGHMRFFTWREIVRLFNGANLDVIDRRCLYKRKLRRRALMLVTLGAVEQYLTRQYLVVGRRRG
jgi:SAM-dependent methyltransferase